MAQAGVATILLAACASLAMLLMASRAFSADDGLQAALLDAYRRELRGLSAARARVAADGAPSAAEASGAPGGGAVAPQGVVAPQGAVVPRMQPTMERMRLASDVEDWSKRPKRSPPFRILYAQLYGKMYDDQDNMVMSFPNPYGKKPHMDYPHSSLWLQGDKIMDRVFKELGQKKVDFIVEAGSMHGGSAIRMAIELDKRGLREVPILCIDPWTGDLNMWLNRVVWEHLDIRHGRATTFDQFMVNVRHAIVSGMIAPHHIVPFPVSSVIGARWLQATGFTPTLIYLDSAHEVDETYYELCLYYQLLAPGGILMGDDYGWPAVKVDVDRFVQDKRLELNMFGVYYNWFVKKPG